MDNRKTYKQLIELAPEAIYKTIEKNRSKTFRRVKDSNRIYFVGSGSSYSVALYGAMLFNQFTNYQAVAVAPREFIELGRSHSTVVLISQGGWNIDIIEASKKAIQLDCICTAVTESEDSEFVKIIGKDNSMMLMLCDEKECFANSQGVVASFAVMLLLLDKVNSTNMSIECDYMTLFNESYEQVHKYKYICPNNRYYYALGTGFAKPALHECVLKTNEVVLEECSADELKNFTHGKHLLQYLKKENRTILLFSDLESLNLTEEVKRKLIPIFDEVLMYSSSVPFPWSAFSHLFHVFNLTCYLCELKGKTKPCYFDPPQVLLDLYKANSRK